jgi:hypothetical protein
VSIADDIAAEAERLNAIDDALDVAGVLMHPDTADKVCAHLGGQTVAEHYAFCYRSAELLLDASVPMGLAIPQSRKQVAEWKARR